jgi:tRNA(adenine34) deaminase
MLRFFNYVLIFLILSNSVCDGWLHSGEFRVPLQIALDQAKKAFELGEVPVIIKEMCNLISYCCLCRHHVKVGAVILDPRGSIIASAHNSVEGDNDPTAHAEVNCIRSASKHLKSWRLSGCTLVSTLEPCGMCLNVARAARMKNVVFGASDSKRRSARESVSEVDAPLNQAHDCKIEGPIDDLDGECSQILTEFFRFRRIP